jgi:hypothetical protein
MCAFRLGEINEWQIGVSNGQPNLHVVSRVNLGKLSAAVNNLTDVNELPQNAAIERSAQFRPL